MVGKRCTMIPFQDSNTRHAYLLKSSNRPYSPCTLVDNWYDERIEIQEKKYHRTISPTVTMKERCECGKSSYTDNYTDPKLIKRSDVPTFEEQYIRYKSNIYKGKESTALALDSKYAANCTTTHDIMYRLNPQRDTWSKITDRPVKVPKREDMLEGYGNDTNFGLRNWLKHIRNQENIYRTDDTTYTISYQHPKMPIRTKWRNCSDAKVSR